MRPRKQILLVTTRGELRFMLQNSRLHVQLHSAECREDLKALILSGTCQPLMAVIDIRDMAAKGADAFVAKIRDSFSMLPIAIIARAGEEKLFGADLIVHDVAGMSAVLIETVWRLAVLKRGPKKAPATQLQESVAV